MKLKVALVLVTTIALASVAQAQPQPLQQVVPTEYTLKLKPADVDKLGKGLAKLPFEDVAELMQTLRNQILEQQQTAAKPEPKKK